MKTHGAMSATIGLVATLLWAGSAHGNDRRSALHVLPGFLDGETCTYTVPAAALGRAAKKPLVLSVGGWAPSLNELFGTAAFLTTAGHPVINIPTSVDPHKTVRMVRDAFGLLDLLKLEEGAFAEQAWKQRENGSWGYLFSASDALRALHGGTTAEHLVVVAHCAGVRPVLEVVKEVLTAPRPSPPPAIHLIALNPSNPGEWFRGRFVPRVAIEATFANDGAHASLLEQSQQEVQDALKSHGGDWESLLRAWQRGKLNRERAALVEKLDLRAPIQAISDDAKYPGRFSLSVLVGGKDTHMPPELHGQRLHEWTRQTADPHARIFQLRHGGHWFEGVKQGAFNRCVLSAISTRQQQQRTKHHLGRP